MFIILSVLKLNKSKEPKDLQLQNIPSIFSTKSVLKLDKSK